MGPIRPARLQPSGLVLNADQGPEHQRPRTPCSQRRVDCGPQPPVSVRLAYDPPSPRKYNPVARVWAALDKPWHGAMLESVETALHCARTLPWQGKHPVVHWLSPGYATGVKLSKPRMAADESHLKRLPGLERWFVDIPACPS